jgi:hypothetical protein
MFLGLLATTHLYFITFQPQPSTRLRDAEKCCLLPLDPHSLRVDQWFIHQWLLTQRPRYSRRPLPVSVTCRSSGNYHKRVRHKLSTGVCMLTCMLPAGILLISLVTSRMLFSLRATRAVKQARNSVEPFRFRNLNMSSLSLYASLTMMFASSVTCLFGHGWSLRGDMSLTSCLLTLRSAKSSLICSMNCEIRKDRRVSWLGLASAVTGHCIPYSWALDGIKAPLSLKSLQSLKSLKSRNARRD